MSRVCLALTLLITVLLSAVAHGAEAVERPNILLIVADDLGWADVGWHGGPYKTPVMDKLVREGVELDQHYVQPVCTPTRTALMSGRYPSRFGSHTLDATNLRAMPLGTETLAAALQSIGYETYMAGKWHLGSRAEWGPNLYGFQHSYGSLAGAVDPWTHKYRPGAYVDTWHRNCKFIEGNEADKGNAMELVGDQIVDWIERGAKHPNHPWFIYVPFYAVHNPVDAPDEYKKLYEGAKFDDEAERQDSRLRLASMISQMDTNIGKFVEALDATQQRDNTLIIFTSDNGGLESVGNPYIGDVPGSPLNSNNLPLRGQKATLYEGGIRVDAFANWPGHLAPRKLEQPMHAVDWFPTLAALVGYRPAHDLHWDGKNMWPAIDGETTDIEPRTIYVAARKGAALRVGDWKLIQLKNGSPPELYNLARDPYETTNLAESEPQQLAKLQKELEAVRARDVTTLPHDLQGLPDIK